MMRGTNVVKLLIVKQLRKPFISQSSCRHFKALTRFLRFGKGIKMFHMQFHTFFGAEISHKILIAVTFPTPKMEIAMRGDKSWNFGHFHKKAKQ